MNNSFDDQRREKLDLLLSKVQTEENRDMFIYGVTSRIGRPLLQRVNDFFIDHGRVPSKERAYFYELLGTMLQAGIPINRALKILITKTENARMRRIIATVAYELEHGKPLSQALDRFSDIFPDYERGILQSAEAVGNLEPILFKIADNLNRQSDISMKLKSAFIYPIMVLIALAIGFTVLLVVVVPKIESIFKESSISLPLPTRVLLSASSVLTGFWWLFVIVIIFAIVFFHLYVNSDEGRFVWDFKKLRIPFVGALLRKTCILRFTDLLGLLVEGGLPINKALEYVANSIGNEVYRVKTYEAIGYIQEGQKLSVALSRAPFLFPESVVNMLAVGEHAASIGDVSQKIGAQYRREIDFTLQNLTTVLGPALILVIGVTVAFFALAVLSPIFSLTQAVQ